MRHPRPTRRSPGRAFRTALLLAGALAPPFAALAAAEPAPDAPAAPPPAAAAKAAAPPGVQPPVSSRPVKQPETLFELLVAGGIVMIPIGLCSLIALAIMFERMISLRLNVVAPPSFLDRLKAALGDPARPDTARAIDACQSEKTPIAEILRAGVARLALGPEAIEKAIEDAGGRIVQKMKRSLRPLISIANLATLLGLLGTIYGLITAFQATAQQSLGKAQMLAEGIYVALVTTAAGLTVAIPILVIHLWLISQVEKMVDAMDEQATEFLEFTIYRLGSSGAPEAVAGDPAASPKPLGATVEGGAA